MNFLDLLKELTTKDVTIKIYSCKIPRYCVNVAMRLGEKFTVLTIDPDAGLSDSQILERIKHALEELCS